MKGFTLIELLISVAIGAVLLGGAIAAYRGLGVRQQVKQAGITFQTDLKSYQQKALSGQKPAECGGGDSLTGYRIRYVDSNTYSVKAVCQTNNPVAVAVDLPGQINFSANFPDIFFPVLHGQVTGPQTITLTKDSLNFSVIIESSGVIRGQML